MVRNFTSFKGEISNKFNFRTQKNVGINVF